MTYTDLVIQVNGSWGTLFVEPVTGIVLAYDDFGCLPDPDGYPGYSDITRVDLVEWCVSHGCADVPRGIDILDVAFWTNSGQYVEAAKDWREEVVGLVPLLEYGGETMHG